MVTSPCPAFRPPPGPTSREATAPIPPQRQPTRVADDHFGPKIWGLFLEVLDPLLEVPCLFLEVRCEAVFRPLLRLGPGFGSLRVVSYNTQGGPKARLENVLQAVGEEKLAGIAKPIGLLLLQEQGARVTLRCDNRSSTTREWYRFWKIWRSSVRVDPPGNPTAAVLPGTCPPFYRFDKMEV